MNKWMTMACANGRAGTERPATDRPLVPLLPLSRFNERLIGGCIVGVEGGASTVALLVSYMRAHYSLPAVRVITQIALIDKRAPIILIVVVWCVLMRDVCRT